MLRSVVASAVVASAAAFSAPSAFMGKGVNTQVTAAAGRRAAHPSTRRVRRTQRDARVGQRWRLGWTSRVGGRRSGGRRCVLGVYSARAAVGGVHWRDCLQRAAARQVLGALWMGRARQNRRVGGAAFRSRRQSCAARVYAGNGQCTVGYCTLPRSHSAGEAAGTACAPRCVLHWCSGRGSDAVKVQPVGQGRLS